MQKKLAIYIMMSYNFMAKKESRLKIIGPLIIFTFLVWLLKYFIQDVKNNKSFRDNENKVVNTEKKKAFIRGILGIIVECAFIIYIIIILIIYK